MARLLAVSDLQLVGLPVRRGRLPFGTT